MEELGKIHQLIIPLFGHNITLNVEVILFTWLVIGLLIILALVTTRRRGLVPGNMQIIGETIVSALYDLTRDALDEELAKKYAPMVCALFMFLAISNSLGIVPFLEEPTKDLNVPLSFGIWDFLLPITAALRKKG